MTNRRRSRTLIPIIAGATVASVALSGVAGATTEPDDEAGGTGGTLRIYSSEPAHMVPTAGNDQPSILVIRQLYSGLVDYDLDGEPVNDIAESIESEDNITWTVTLREGFTFHNGEPVNADAFIRAWNYAADGDNAQDNAFFFGRIAGYTESEGGADALSGLTKVDDMTFTVELSAPFVGFPAIVGYSGFFPVAEACLADFAACEETPIGNGPYQIEGSWDHDVGITLVRYDDYPDPGKSNPDVLEYRIFADVDSGYAAFQAGEIDIMYTVPPERYQEIVETQGATEQLFEVPSHSFTYIGLPQYLDQFQDPRIGQAMSMAIDRGAIIDNVLDGRFTPAEGLVSPLMAGFRENACEFCVYDPEAAAALLEEAGGWQWGELTLWANAGAGHDIWLQAVGDQLREALGIEYTLEISLEFPEYLDKLDAEEMTGPFRLGWGPDYPVIETYLTPLYGTGGSSNNVVYSNPEVDELIAQGDAAPSIDEAIPFYNQAEDLILADMPSIPMWFGREAVIWSDNVEEMVYNPINDTEYGQMVVSEG